LLYILMATFRVIRGTLLCTLLLYHQGI
jgi:hypothetical protein